MNEKIFKEYFARLRKEAWIKAFIAALVFGFSVLFVSSLVIWLTGFKFVWLSVILWAAATVLTMPVFYFWKLIPSKKMVAQRMDSLGLEERILTMVEFEGKEDSYILRRQREDALAAINSISAKLIKFAIPVAMIVAVSISAVLGIGMTTVSALSADGVIKSGNEIIEEITAPEIPEYEITYEVEGEGFINGELFLIDTVKQGEDALEVIAEEMDGWTFLGWSTEQVSSLTMQVWDGKDFKTVTQYDKTGLITDPILKLTDVQSDMHFIATFIELEEGEDEGDEEGEGDESGDTPGDPKPSDEPSNGDPADNPPKGEPTASGKLEPSNQIIDGNTWYGGSTFDNAYDAAMGETAGNGDISGDGQDMVGNYMNGIQQ